MLRYSELREELQGLREDLKKIPDILWIKLHNWLASNPDTVKLRKKVDRILAANEATLGLFNVAVSDNPQWDWKVDLNGAIVLGGDEAKWERNVLFNKLLRTMTDNLTIRNWKIHFSGKLINSDFIQLLDYHWFNRWIISKWEWDQFILSCTFSNPSKSGMRLPASWTDVAASWSGRYSHIFMQNQPQSQWWGKTRILH